MSYIFKKNKNSGEWKIKHQDNKIEKQENNLMDNCIYRFLNNKKEVIYIGKAKNLLTRLNNHNHLPAKCYNETTLIEYIKFKTGDDVDFAERYFIGKYKPKYNTMLKGKTLTFNIQELNINEWIELEEKINLLPLDTNSQNKTFTERERSIINFMNNIKICTNEQLTEIFFDGLHHSVSYRVLKGLVDDKLIKRKYYRVGNKNVYIYYTDKLPSKRYIAHDLFISQIAIQLIKYNFEIVNYVGKENLYIHIDRYIRNKYKTYKDAPQCLDYNSFKILESLILNQQ